MNSYTTAELHKTLELLWCQAVDAATSKDFRNSNGSLNEDAYLRYQRNAIIDAESRIQQLMRV